MLRKIGLPIIAVLLISSLLAPPVLALLDQNCAMAMMISSDEEEKGSEKEAEKKQDENNLFVNHLVAAHNMFSKEKQSNPMGHVFHLTEYKPEIVVPPPRMAHFS